MLTLVLVISEVAGYFFLVVCRIDRAQGGGVGFCVGVGRGKL